MTTLTIYNLKDELIYKQENIDNLLNQYGIDKDDQESFEEELLGDILEQGNIQYNEVYYELKETNGDYFTSLFFTY